MPKYYILYTGPEAPKIIYQTDVDKNSEQEVRSYFTRFYPLGKIQGIRKGKGFTESEINKKRSSLKYAQ